MLFDLRSRHRRTAVRVIYIFLALLMGGGLVLVGVGTGNGNGGLLNAFGGGGGGGSTNDAFVTKQLNTALKQTRANPNSSAAWVALMQARLAQAQSGSNYNSNTSTYTAAARPALNAGVDAWNHYLKVTHDKPALNGAELGKSFYKGLQDWGGMAGAYEYIVRLQGESKFAGVFTCLAYTSYAAGRQQLGDLAAAKAVKLTPELQRATLQTTFTNSSKTTTTAQQYSLAEC